MKGCDVGLVLKRFDSYGSLNDRLYTPNKMFDYIAAGLPVVCSRQLSLRMVATRGLGVVLPKLSPDVLRAVLTGLAAENFKQLNVMKATVSEAFRSDLNYERASRDIITHIIQ
jgi:hypothetical protein